MEGKKLLLHLRGEQCCRDEAARQTELRAEGLLYRTGCGWRIVYGEPEESGMGRTETELSLYPAGAVLTRQGDVCCRLRFQPGHRSRASYETACGSMELEVDTLSLGSAVSEAGGSVRIRYRLRAGGQDMGETLFQMTLREK